MSVVFEIHEKAVEGAAVLRVVGHLNAKSTTQLLEHCRVVRSSKRSVILNLSEVEFIASSGIGALLALTEEFREDGLMVRYADLSSAVDSVLRLLNLQEFLGIDESVEDAIRSIAA